MTKSSSTDKTTQSDEDIKQAVRETYARAISKQAQSCCSTSCCSAKPTQDAIGAANYSPEELAELPADAVENSFGCGNPLAFAGVRPGDVVLDIGSGAGIDVLLASRIVGAGGKVIGLDFTPEMIARGRENAARAGVENVEFRLGDADHMPLDNASVDWVISNCVINLAPDKRKVFGEVYRVLKPGGRVSISDIVTGELPEDIRDNLALWANCVAGAVGEDEYLKVMRDAGLVDVRVASRQHYDASSIRAFVDGSTLGITDQASLHAILARGEELVKQFWSAKVVARKPA